MNDRKLAEFDATALLDLLDFLGYRSEEILFQSRPGYASERALLHSLEFRSQPIQQAIVTFNFGLLGPNGPLPSYLRELIETGEVDEQTFTEFLRFFDHVLIQARLNATYPERGQSVFKDWEKTKRSYLNLLGIRSVGTLHWLFEMVFPELGVKVERGSLMRNVQLEGARLGSAQLGGGAVLGGWARVPVPGFVVTLYSDEEHTDFSHPWAAEVRSRLERLIFPVVAESALDLRVSLVIRSEKVWAQLKPGSYLGFDRIKGGTRRNREVQVFKGQVTPALLATLAKDEDA